MKLIGVNNAHKHCVASSGLNCRLGTLDVLALVARQCTKNSMMVVAGTYGNRKAYEEYCIVQEKVQDVVV